MAKVPRRFVHETLWPEYEQLAAVLRRHLEDVTDRVISAAIHEDASETIEAEPVGELAAGSREE